VKGKPLLLSFWVMESPECQKNLDRFRDHSVRWDAAGLQLFTVNLDLQVNEADIVSFARTRRYSFPILPGSSDVGAIYNIVFLYLFDRHRDLPLPTSFLIDQAGNIVKVYQGVIKPDRLEIDVRNIPKAPAEGQRAGLPFQGLSNSLEFRRNYLSFGSIFFQRGYYEQAEAAFRQALSDNSASAEALYGLGSVYLKQEKKSEAQDAFERATKLQGDYPETLPNAWNNLGLLDAREGRTEAAILDFQTALRLSPNHLIALNNLGNAYRQAKQWDDARRAFEQVLSKYPEDADANYGLAMVFAQQDDSNRAYEHLQKALKSRPEFPEALNNLGILYLRTNHRDEAVATFEKCIRVAPGFDQAYMNLARVYAIEGANDKARAVLSDLLKQRPGHSQAEKALEQLGH
jgi:tetratricopeptide (TPR) repeat protein/peroxiredoxin